MHIICILYSSFCPLKNTISFQVASLALLIFSCSPFPVYSFNKCGSSSCATQGEGLAEQHEKGLERPLEWLSVADENGQEIQFTKQQVLKYEFFRKQLQRQNQNLFWHILKHTCLKNAFSITILTVHHIEGRCLYSIISNSSHLLIDW